jgi:hypothetical protein
VIRFRKDRFNVDVSGGEASDLEALLGAPQRRR